ncbi:uncharacterized protein LOC142545805 isoform X2 [Primulina tabacum]|uniref:uncharacterized protein LOC142545805 isoform X2 n=1 Tax=Primulina tabacum TaxID=48773 RepID=UPI003F59E117
MKAIRLVANKLYPLSFISEKIEDFAEEMLLSVVNDNQTVVKNEADVTQLLMLPPAQLENALNRTPALRFPLVAHANQPHIRSSLPRSSLVVLGIASDAQTSNQPKTTQSPTGENGNSDKGAVTE